jgi:hypothetical protein
MKSTLAAPAATITLSGAQADPVLPELVGPGRPTPR